MAAAAVGAATALSRIQLKSGDSVCMGDFINGQNYNE